MSMSHEDLARIIEKRLDKIETKIDAHMEAVSTNKADIQWVKGFVKLNLSGLMAVIGAFAAAVFKGIIKI